MTTVKTKESTKKLLDHVKRMDNSIKSYDEAIRRLVTKYLDRYCCTKDGYAGIGDVICISGEAYTIVDITEGTVYARSKDTVEEFHSKGKVAWSADIVKRAVDNVY